MVTINGVLATVASSVDDDLLTLGRATEQDDVRGPARFGDLASPATSSCSTMPSPSIPWSSTSPPDAAIEDPIVIVHVVTGGGAGRCSPARWSGRGGVGGRGHRDRGRCRRRAAGRPPLGHRLVRTGPAAPERRAPGGAGDRNRGGRRRQPGLREHPVVGPATPGSSPIRPAPSGPSRRCGVSPWPSVGTTPGSGPTRHSRGSRAPACSGPPSSAGTTRCSTSGPCRTTWRPAPPATCCSWERWPTVPTRSTAG